MKKTISTMKNNWRIQEEKVKVLLKIENDTLVNNLLQNIRNVKKYSERK